MRLLTRLDFDGLACGALLVHLGLVNEWEFVHPKDIQDGLITRHRQRYSGEYSLY